MLLGIRSKLYQVSVPIHKRTNLDYFSPDLKAFRIELFYEIQNLSGWTNATPMAPDCRTIVWTKINLLATYPVYSQSSHI
jgi:hypothetical protein